MVGSLYSWVFGAPKIENNLKAPDKGDIDELYKVMREAESYDEWKGAADKLDDLEGNNEWKRIKTSPLFDHILLTERLKQMHPLEAQDRLPSIVHWIRSGLQRNYAGTGNSELYDHSHVGTKTIIEQHQDGLVRMLERVAEGESEAAMPLEKRLAFFTESRHALGKTAVLLSGGIHLGMYHLGVVKALHHAKLLPRILSGSSAGAVVAAIVGVCSDEELSVLTTHGLQAFFSTFLSQEVVSEQTKWHRIISTGHIMDVSQLQKGLKEIIGDFTLHEAYERTGRIINITVSPDNAFEKPRLLNYITAPNVLLWSAATASCGSPGQGEADAQLWVKGTDGREQPYSLRYQQNGVRGKWAREEMNAGQSLHTDLPMNRLQELFNVNYFIVSQTNPHAVPFLQKCHKKVQGSGQHGQAQAGLVSRVLSGVGSFAMSEVKHRCQQAITLGMAPRLLKLTMEQKYTGDVTIVPQVRRYGAGVSSYVLRYYRIRMELAYPPRSLSTDGAVWGYQLSFEHYMRLMEVTEVTLQSYVQAGERCTWPFLSMIRGNCQLEFVLDECTRKVATKIQQQHLHPRRPPSQPASQPKQTAQCHSRSDIHSSFCNLQQTEAAAQAAIQAQEDALQQEHLDPTEGGDADESRLNLVSSSFTPSFRQKRHTHLDLNDFFSSSASTESAGEEEETAPRRHKLSHTGNLAAITSFTGDVDESVDARKLAVITSSTTSPQSMNPQCKVPNVRSAQPEETCA